MQNKQSTNQPILTLVKGSIPLLVVLALLVAFPFIVAILDGQAIPDMLANEPGNAKFMQGLMIEIFILAIFALSYDLVFGVTGLLSFGHAMFFAVGAYFTGIMLKSFEWSLLPTLGLVVVAGVVQALLFSVVLPRVHGITFALVTLGMTMLNSRACKTPATATRPNVGSSDHPKLFSMMPVR